MKISKRATLILKGIAVIAMFYHHFCGFPEWLAEGLECRPIIPLSIQGLSLLRITAVFGCICVGIFACLSGYSFGINGAGSFRERIKKCFILLQNYWIIVILFAGTGLLFQEPMPTLKMFFYNLFGIHALPNGTWICVTFAWYISFYILTILLLPPVHNLLDRIKHNELIILVWGGGYLLVLFEPKLELLNLILPDFFKWGPLFSIGYYLAKYDVIAVIAKLIGNPKKKLLFSILTLLLVFAIKCVVGGMLFGINMYILYTPPFLIALFYLIDYLEQYNVAKWGMNIFAFLGTYSMNLWLLHGIFFTPNRSLQFIAYWPKYGIWITGWALLLLLPFSIGLKKLMSVKIKK